MPDVRFAYRFKECRKKKGYTQQQLAEITKLQVGYISKVEQGITFPRFEKLVILMNVLGVSADEIFCDVVEASMDHRASEVVESLDGLPMEIKGNILEVVELLVQQYHANQVKTGTEQIDNPHKT